MAPTENVRSSRTANIHYKTSRHMSAIVNQWVGNSFLLRIKQHVTFSMMFYVMLILRFSPWQFIGRHVAIETPVIYMQKFELSNR